MSRVVLGDRKMHAHNRTERFIRWFADIGLNDIASVGGKNASLGEMYRELAPHGVRFGLFLIRVLFVEGMRPAALPM